MTILPPMLANRRKLKARAVFAANLKRLRIARGLSQEALAAAARLHRTYVGSCERAERNISIDNLEKLANALNVPLRELVDGEAS